MNDFNYCRQCWQVPCICHTSPSIPSVPQPQWTPVAPPSVPTYPAVEPEPPLTHDEIRRVRRLLRRTR